MVLYEYPFNEGIRTMLRLEHLFGRLETLIGRDGAIDHQDAINTPAPRTRLGQKRNVKHHGSPIGTRSPGQGFGTDHRMQHRLEALSRAGV